MKKKLIFIVGPTGVGKTKLSTDIASYINAQIISCDSMQIYKEFDIGTAKVKKSEMKNIKHHLIDIICADENFNVNKYKTLAEKEIENIYSKNNIPIFVGGTGLYVDSIIYDLKFTKSIESDELRKKITDFYNKFGKEVLYDLLLYLDYECKNKIHINNVKRVIRAIEVCINTKMKFSKQLSDYKKINEKYNVLILGLYMDRKILYSNIDKRVDNMIKNGLLDEVLYLYNKYSKDCQPFTAIGYKEFIPYFNKEITFEKCIENIKQNSRNYAKRQFTWFRKNKDIKWIDMNTDYDKILKYSLMVIDKFLKGDNYE